MNKLGLIILIFPLATFADRIDRTFYKSDLGRGVLEGEKFGANCVTGSTGETSTPKKIIYKFNIRPVWNGSFAQIDTKWVWATAEMVITDGKLSMSEVKIKDLSSFEQKCGTHYLAQISLGVSVSRRVKMDVNEAFKITPIDIVAANSDDLVEFENAVAAQLAHVESIRGSGMSSTGFLHGPDFGDYDLSLIDLFKKFENQWPNGGISRMGVEGFTETYP